MLRFVEIAFYFLPSVFRASTSWSCAGSAANFDDLGDGQRVNQWNINFMLSNLKGMPLYNSESSAISYVIIRWKVWPEVQYFRKKYNK